MTGIRVQGPGIRGQGSGFRGQGSGFREGNVQVVQAVQVVQNVQSLSVRELVQIAIQESGLGD
jgi:hypothetical protein